MHILKKTISLESFLHLKYSIPITHGTKCNSGVRRCSSVRINIYGKQTISREGSIKLRDDILHLNYWNADSFIRSDEANRILHNN